MRRLASILLAVLFLTAAYVYAWPSANVPYFAAIIAHLLAGIVFLVAVIWAAQRIWQESTPAGRVGWILAVAGGLIGVALIFTGTRRAEWALLYVHIGVCAAGGAFIASAWAGKRGILAGSYIAWVFRCAIFLI